jgi:hypothetical protein
VHAAGRTMIELTQPWGEYYAANQRSIPPMLYAEMVVQSGIQFDVFGVQVKFGVPRDGCWQRDLFQISSLLDRFAPFGKPVMISALQVPSHSTEGSGPASTVGAGVWRKPWSEALQAKWLEAVTDVALSKPFVEAICWQDLVDLPAKLIAAGQSVPHGGMATMDATPKQTMKTWASLRRAVMSFRTTPAPGPSAGGTTPAPSPAAAPPAPPPGAEAPPRPDAGAS